MLRHVEYLVGSDVVLAHERAVVRSNHGDVGVLPRAELGVVVARLGVNHGCCGRGTGGRRGPVHTAIAERGRSSASDQQSQGIGCGGNYSSVARSGHGTIVVSGGSGGKDFGLSIAQGPRGADLFVGT